MTHKNVMLNPQLNQLYPASLCPADDLWDTISFLKGGEGGLFLESQNITFCFFFVVPDLLMP